MADSAMYPHLPPSPSSSSDAPKNPLQSKSVAALIVAAGRGSRFGGNLPKQYAPLGGRMILTRTIAGFAETLPDAVLCVAIHADDAALYDKAVSALSPDVSRRLLPPVLGGATRQESVFNGLKALSQQSLKIVLIHDAARPFVSAALIHDAVSSAEKHGAAVPGFAVTDTIKSVDGAGLILTTPDRAFLRAVQTPQAFLFDLILAAHARAAGEALTDDAAVAERAGHAVYVFPGDSANMKITTMDDLAQAERRLAAELNDIRVGQGFDVHAFEAGDHVWLGGIAIPHTKKLLGHSDADVLLHAVTDAIFGALADGDIGSHFPPSDPQWKGAASAIFLAYACERVRQRGGMIAHVDATIIAEQPKIGPHRDAIRQKLAEIMGVSLERVAVKATTSERLGYTGREEGMAAMATATVRLPG